MSNTGRRMSMSGGTSPYISQSDMTTSTSSIRNNNKTTPKGYFLSRFKYSSSTTTNASTPPLSPSNSTTISSLPTIGQQQKIKRKPVLPTPPSSTTTTSSGRKKYEALLGINTEEIVLSDDSSKKKNNTLHHTKTGFNSLFKRKSRSRSIDKKSSGPPEIITPSSSFIKEQKFELPPLLHHQQQPRQPLVQQLDVQPVITPPSILLPNYKPQYYQYEVKEQPSLAFKQQQQQQQQVPPPLTTRWSNTSNITRKSTGSNSIYSTFGPDSIYGGDANNSNDMIHVSGNTITAATSMDNIHEEETIKETPKELTLADIVANNVQTRNPARIVAHIESEEEEEESSDEDEVHDDEDSSVDGNQSDIFVDATDVSPEDIERERIETKLSKRFSGGHFGSAGGLMMSIMAADDSTKKQKRRSRPPPEDVVQSMMNWKRQSGQSLGKFLQEQQQRDALEDANKHMPPAITLEMVNNAALNKLLPSTPSDIPLPPNPQILFSVTTEEEEEDVKAVEREIEALEIKENNETQEALAVKETEEFDSDDPKECAARLWQEDEDFVPRERIAEWLGQSKILNINTLNEYMEYFDFATMRLDSAFRKVCSKLYFRAEAQQIDRILEAFAKRYWLCNPKTIFGSADTVYAVVYSLLLLNTDLHVAQGSYTRMTRQAFVKNTMSTILDQLNTDTSRTQRSPTYMLAWEAHIESYLKDMYISVKNYQILQPSQNQSGMELNNDFLTPTPSSSKRMSMMMGGKRMIDIKRSLNTMIHKNSNARESMLFVDEPSPRKSSSSSTTATNRSSPMQRMNRRESFSSTHSGNSANGIAPSLSSPRSTNGALLSPNQSHMMNFMDTHASALFANRPPYLKEGVVMRKHLLESANQKAKHREWRECLLVVGQGELKMYGLQSENNDTYAASNSARRNMIRQSSASFANLADSLTKNHQTATSSVTNVNASVSFGGVSQTHNNRWAAYSQLINTIELNHSLANALPPPGYNRTRPHVFAIQEPNGGVYLIQAGSQEQINEWVSTCNYWAARQSKEPLQGGVSNIEYGWGACLDDVVLDLDAVESGKKITGKYFNDPDAVNVSIWVPPAPTMVSSILDEVTHYNTLQKYLDSLNEEINEHREIKKKVLVKFPSKTQNHARALLNWEAKSKYMLHEIIKYQNYCDVLEKSIQRRNEEGEHSQREEETAYNTHIDT